MIQLKNSVIRRFIKMQIEMFGHNLRRFAFEKLQAIDSALIRITGVRFPFRVEESDRQNCLLQDLSNLPLILAINMARPGSLAA